VRRLALVLCLIAGLCLQGFALAGQMAALARTGDAVHSALHLDAVSHHHGHDGSIHKDASKKSLKHVHGGCCMQLAGVLPAAPPKVPGLHVASARLDAADLGHDSPFIEGLKRPPR
jgi:hypothetical protein